MPLTPEEEKRFREEIRRKLEEREKKEIDRKHRQEEQKRKMLEDRLRSKIKEEEEERYFTEKGYVKYLNRHGEIEWLPPEEAERRKSTRRTRKTSTRHRRKKDKYKKIGIEVGVVFALFVVFVVFYKFNPVKKPATGSVVIQSSVPGAVIYLNGEETDFFTPDTIKNVETGNYYISVFRDGYAVFPPMKSVPVSKNRISKADFELKNMSAMALARVHVNVSKYRLYVDGLPFPVDAEGYAKVPYGYHTFMVVKEGFLGYPSYRRLLLEKDDTTDVQFELVPDTEIGYLQISDNIFGGYVYLDKQFTGLQARGNLLPVKAGIYEVRVRENGYRCVPDSQLINLLPGEKRLLVFRMVPEEKSASLTVRSGEPGAAIFLDGNWVPYVTPVMDLKVSPGHHYINLARGGLQYSALDKPVNIGNTELPEYYFDF